MNVQDKCICALPWLFTSDVTFGEPSLSLGIYSFKYNVPHSYFSAYLIVLAQISNLLKIRRC